MPLTQTKITKFFKPAKLSEWIKILRKNRKSKPAVPTKAKDTKLASKPTSPKYTPPHKRTTPASNSKPQAKSQTRPHASPAPKPAKLDTTKGKKTEQPPTPQNAATLAYLTAHVSPRFFFPKDQRPQFSVLFPGTSRPKVTMLHGTPTIDKEIFNTLLRSRIAAAHTVLRTAKLARPRLPKSFVSSQIHLIQSSLQQKKKVKKEASSPTKDKKSKASAKDNQATLPPPKQLEFIPATTPTSEKKSSLSPEELATAKLRSSDIQTPATADMHALIFSIRNRRSLIAKARLTNTLVPYHEYSLHPEIQSIVRDCLTSLSIDTFSFPESVNQSTFTVTFDRENISVSSEGFPQTLGYLQKQLEFKIVELITLATQI
jgi:hypothetical protein